MYREAEIKFRQSQWDDIQRRLDKLKALEAGGVHNWALHDIVLADWQAKVNIEDSINDAVQDINDFLTDADIDQPAGPGCGYAISYDEKEMEKILVRFYERHSKLRML